MSDINNLPEECLHGNCFQLAYQFMDHEFHEGNLRLVHGMVNGQGELKGWRYIHAWVEDLDSDMVIDLTQSKAFQVLPRDIYYKLGHINKNELKSYDIAGIYQEILTNSTYGP